MAINKVEYGDQTLIDLTSDTVNADELAVGLTAHAANGTVVTGLAPKTWTGTKAQYESAKSGLADGTLVNITDDYLDASTIGLVDYSTEETYTGVKWINGKKIYRKVFNFNSSIGLISDTWVDSGISKGEMSLFINGVIISASVTPVLISIDLGSLSNGNIGINTHRSVTLSPWTLIVEYTKTEG